MRQRIFDEEEVIAKAIEVFWRRGYEAASADVLLDAMGIGKGSFYLAFKGGKRELFEKSLVQFGRQSLNQFKKDLQAADDPIAFLRGFFFSVASSTKERHERGCYLGNAIAEMASMDKEMEGIAVNILKELELQFTTIIRDAQKNKTIRNTEKPEVLARYLINLWNGINITRRMYPEKRTLESIIEIQLQVLK